ncbi:hypothetical protein ACTGU5_01575 [Streptococcus suis]|uniref:Conjugal transfer protein TrbL n=1 Tax=Streptococcus suis TaxID=1307 RepID=A0AAW5LJC4_STRSU|nr:hypothetical protein [Streptococcus suis]MCR1232140.1 hypothetical protein [Streptococcus suis]
MIMNFTSPFVFLASEKVSSDSLFEGFQVDLESTANLVKSLADFNPTVWSYMTAITKGIMQPLGVAILAVVLVLEFSKMAKKIANSGGAMTFEAMAPMIVSYIMVYAVQGILIFLIVSLVPLFESAGKIAVSNGAGVMESLAIMFGGLVQAILLIIALVGSQRTARSILGM